MTWVQKIFDFFIDYGDVVKQNLFVFITYGIICIGLFLGINTWLNTRNEKKNHDKIEELSNKIIALEEENKSLKEQFNQYGIAPRIMSGTGNQFPAPTATLIAKSIKKKK